MASREEWCAEKLSRLLQEDLRITTLGEIKEHLSTLPQSEATTIANLLDLPLVFDCLNDSNTEQIDLACEVLSLCLNSLSLGESTTRYDVPLERALSHPHSAVKIMALTEIERNVLRDDALVDLCKRKSLVNSIVRCIGDPDIGVAKRALDIVSLIGASSFGLKTLISNDIIEVIREVMDLNEVVRLRIYELALNISKESEENMAVIKSTGLLSQVLAEIDTRDVLLRMNVVEMLSSFCSTKHGLKYLEESKILFKLFAIIENEDDPISCQLCEPGVLKFFAGVAHSKPLEMFSKYPKLFDRIFSNLESNDLTIVSVSLDTLGVIGSSNEGKNALHSTGNRMTYAVKTIAKLLSSLPTDVRLRALNCLENLLRVNEKTNDIMQITRKWYTLIGDDPMELILRYAKNPFSEIKLAGLGILQAIAEQQWGQEEMRNTPGLIEFLLNRNIEVIKECKELKYEVVKSLSTSTTIDQLTLDRLREFVKEGPFYVEAVTEIAFEGDD